MTRGYDLIIDHPWESPTELFADIKDSRNRFWWVSKIPRMQDLRRAYWVFLLLCLGNSRIPAGLVRFIADRKILRKHPELLTEAAVIDMRGGAWAARSACRHAWRGWSRPRSSARHRWRS